MKSIVIIIAQLLMFQFISRGQVNDIVVNYAPTGNIELGASIDYRYPERSKDRAITNRTAEKIDGTTANSTTFSGTLISDISKLYSKLNITYDVTASGSVIGFLSASAEMHAKLDLEDDYTNNKLYYLIEATSNYGREGYTKASISEVDLSLMKTNPSEFIRKYGTHFAKYQTKTASVYLLYEISTSNKFSKNSLFTKFSGKFDFSIVDIGSLSASQSTEFSLFKSESRSLASIKIKFLARSSSGLTTIASLVDTAQSLSGVVNNLKALLKDPSYNIGAVSSYTLVSFEPFGLNMPVMSKSQQVFLQKFNNIKVQLLETKNRFQDYVYKIGNYQFKGYYVNRIQELTNNINQLDQMEINCYDNNNCDTASLRRFDNIPAQWLEEIVDLDSVKLLPSYEGVVDHLGKKVGEIINGVRIIAYGKINNYEYFSNLKAAFLNRDYVIAEADNSVLNGHNIDTSNLIAVGSFKKVDFIFVVDAAKPTQVFNRDANGFIFNDHENVAIVNNFLNELKTRTYFLEATSKDNLKFYTDIGVLNMNSVVTIK